MSAAAIKATFSDFKLIRGRKCAQLVFEVAIEAADEALNVLGGLPRPDQESWCGIARLDTAKLSSAPVEPANINTSPTLARSKRLWDDLSYSTQAGIRCEDKLFQTFLAETFPDKTESPAEIVRSLCHGVGSRSEIVKGSRAGDRWEWICSSFDAWRGIG